MEKIDLTGQRFGKLVVIEEAEPDRQKNGKPCRKWKCQCDCGNIVSVRQNCLTRSEYQTLSCGCYAREARSRAAKQIFTTHGKRKERLYGIWCAMRRRCFKEYDPEYHCYGGRGIKVCDEWDSDYTSFREWAYAHGYDENAKRGECTIDRIDNDGNYEPDNCRIVGMKVQGNNTQRSVYYPWNGGMFTVSQIMDLSQTALSRICIVKRLKRGMTVEEALTTPLMSNQYARA